MLAVSGLMLGGGAFLAATATPAEAAAASCSATPAGTPLVPGASGTCVFTYAETAQQAQHQRFTVTLDIDTVATAAHISGSTATEALLDGRATGLRVSVSDSARDIYGVGAPLCTGAYPNATRCSSRNHGLAIRGAVDITQWSDTFVVAWSLPRSAGNPYQGGSATITLTAHFVGASGSSASGVLTASTPLTGVGDIPISGVVLIVGGVVLLGGGVNLMWLGRRRRPPSR